MGKNGWKRILGICLTVLLVSCAVVGLDVTLGMERKKQLLILCRVLETAAPAGAAVLAVWYILRRNRMGSGEPAEKTSPVLRRNGIWALAGVLSAGLLTAGILLRPRENMGYLGWLLLGALTVVPGFLIGVSRLLYRADQKKWDQRSVRETEKFLMEHRENDHSRELMQRLSALRKRTTAYTAVLSLDACGMVLTAGAVTENKGIHLLAFLLSGCLLACGLSRIYLRTKRVIPREDCVLPQEYPLLYALAEKAEKALGCTGEIRIDLTSECNAGLYEEKGVYNLLLGTVLLSVISEEELYAVLLHEFGHAAAETKASRREKRYSAMLQGDSLGVGLELLRTVCFGFFDCRYMLYSRLYVLTISLKQEFDADQAMVKFGNPQAAASVLLKLAYFDYYRWEENGEAQIFRNAEMSRTNLRDSVDCFRRAMETRGEAWKKLAGMEIQARSASHPTLRSRLDAMGIREMKTLDTLGSEAYTAECEKAIAYVDDFIYRHMEPDYGRQRELYYLEPLQNVEKWVAEGRPLVPETYTDLAIDLKLLHRYGELEQLCDRAIGELPPMSSHDALFMKGSILLHRYDPAGLELIYKSIEANSNHIEEGLEEIGEFCCLTGRQEELDAYRQRASELGQQTKDVYSQLGTLEKSDRLSPEQLPQALQQGLLACIREADSGVIRQVYVVHKQITEEFFTSAVVLRFRKGTDEEQRDEIYHRVFRFLDTTTDWQFSLFDYDHVRAAHVEAIPGSCIYENEAE